MGRAKKMAENIAKSLMFSIKSYRYHVGIYPSKIFAELDAYYALLNENPMLLFDYHQQELTPSRLFGGIPIVPISKEGLGIYLASGPVKFTEFHDSDVELILPEQKKGE